MDEADKLHLERNLLELRLAMLERAIEAQRLEGEDSTELAKRMPPIFERIRKVNAELAELRDPGAST